MVVPFHEEEANAGEIPFFHSNPLYLRRLMINVISDISRIDYPIDGASLGEPVEGRAVDPGKRRSDGDDRTVLKRADPW